MTLFDDAEGATISPDSLDSHWDSFKDVGE